MSCKITKHGDVTIITCSVNPILQRWPKMLRDWVKNGTYKQALKKEQHGTRNP